MEFFLTAIAHAVSVGAVHSGWDNDYSDTAAWSKDFPKCKGTRQSPIDIVTKDVAPGEAYAAFELNYKNAKGLEMKNNGHSFNVAGADLGNMTLYDGNYTVAGFHFHFPSEHRVDGKLMDGEIHIVHQRQRATTTDGLAVVGIFIEAGNEEELPSADESLFHALHFGKLPAEGTKVGVEDIDLSQLLHDQLDTGFYYYEGSLTTPPCSETVHWHLMKKSLKVSKTTISQFKKQYPNPANNRPTQAINGREVGLYSKSVLV